MKLEKTKIYLSTNLPISFRFLARLFRIKIWQEYSVFKCERFNEEKKRWFEEYSFYWGDCKHIFDKDDWRFCEVKGKRKLAVYIGKGWFKFPIKFPVKLDNGIVINELEKP